MIFGDPAPTWRDLSPNEQADHFRAAKVVAKEEAETIGADQHAIERWLWRHTPPLLRMRVLS